MPTEEMPREPGAGAAPAGHAGIDMGRVGRAARLTLGAVFAQRVLSDGDRVALVDGARQWTYAELDARSNRLCRAWRARGLERGDRIAILSQNTAEYVECLVAAAKMGIILACQNWRLAEGELRHCLALVSPKLIIASERFEKVARDFADIAPALVLGAEYERALEEAPADPVPDPCDPEDGVVILYTSGTTGLPKGALISQRAEIARATIQMADVPSGPDDGFVAWAPLFHMVSTDTVFSTLMQGGKVIVTDGFDADELAGIVGREKLGRLTLMPGTIAPFIDAMQRQAITPVGVEWVGVMADLVPREQIAQVTRLLDAPYLNSFGSTETGMPPASRGIIPVGEVPKRLDKLQSSFCQVRLVDPDDNEVAGGEPGELTLRSPALFSGYWNNPEATNEDFRGGWFHMGDVFRRNADGTLSFVDRRKYLIKSGGENIYPAEIERVLLSEPRVGDAVVVRKADPQWGEVPVAFVVRLDAGLTADDLRRLCADHLARYKLPRDFRFVADADLPRSTTGKIQRHKLEEAITREA